MSGLSFTVLAVGTRRPGVRLVHAVFSRSGPGTSPWEAEQVMFHLPARTMPDPFDQSRQRG